MLWAKQGTLPVEGGVGEAGVSRVVGREKGPGG